MRFTIREIDFIVETIEYLAPHLTFRPIDPYVERYLDSMDGTPGPNPVFVGRPENPAELCYNCGHNLEEHAVGTNRPCLKQMSTRKKDELCVCNAFETQPDRISPKAQCTCGHYRGSHSDILVNGKAQCQFMRAGQCCACDDFKMEPLST